MQLSEYLAQPYQNQFKSLPFEDCPLPVATIGDAMFYLLFLNNGVFEVTKVDQQKMSGPFREGLTLREAHSLMVLGGIVRGFELAHEAPQREFLNHEFKKFIERLFLLPVFTKRPQDKLQ